jgi:hypothetical protein
VPLSNQFVNIFGLECRKRRQAKVVQDQHIRLYVSSDALFPGLIRSRGEKASQQFGRFCIEHLLGN